MRILIAVASFVVSGFCYASELAIDSTNFHFEGDWNNSAGQTGTWENESVLEVQSNSPAVISLTQDVTITSGTYSEKVHYEWLFVENDSGNFDVLTADSNKVGDGYCKDTSCHFAITLNGGQVEIDWHYKNNVIYETGSRKFAGGTEIWKGVGTPVNPVQVNQ
jgi:hypothetical protein